VDERENKRTNGRKTDEKKYFKKIEKHLDDTSPFAVAIPLGYTFFPVKSRDYSHY